MYIRKVLIIGLAVALPAFHWWNQQQAHPVTPAVANTPRAPNNNSLQPVTPATERQGLPIPPRITDSKHTKPSQPEVQSAAAAPDTASPSVRVASGLITVRAKHHPIVSLLDAITQESGVPIHVVGHLGDRTVSANLDEIPIEEGIRTLLRGHDFFILYTSNGGAEPSIEAVWVYAPGTARAVAPIPPESWASTEELTHSTADPDPHVRAHAVEELVRREAPQAHAALAEALRDPDDQVRFRALASAIHSALGVSRELLADLARSDPVPDIRVLSMEGLVGTEVEDDVRALVEAALDDPSSIVQSKARDVLTQWDIDAMDEQQGAQLIEAESAL